MNQQNMSPLDQAPYKDFVTEQILLGETNASIVKSLDTKYDLNVTEASIRRFRKRHGIQIPGVSQAYTRIKGDTADAATKPHALNEDEGPVESDPDAMLRERGLDPEEWYIDDQTGIGVNNWEGPSQDGKVTYTQSKFRAKRKKPENFLQPVRSPGLTVQRKAFVSSPDDSELIVVCGDQQAPFFDKGLHKTFCEWLRMNEPSRGVLLGDLLDFPDVSRHPDDPDNTASVQECLQVGYDLLVDYVQASPNTQWYFLLGNHDIRIQRYVIDKAPRVQSLARVTNDKYVEPEFVYALTHLMRLDELGIELVTTNGPYEDAHVVLSSKLAVSHGWKVNQGSGATALKTLQQTGYSIIIGHVHRQSIVYHTTYDINREPTTLVAAEAGCMCRLDGKMDEETGRRFPSYAVLPDWQNGFIAGRIYDDNKFHLSPAIYVNKTLLWEDQRFNGEEE